MKRLGLVLLLGMCAGCSTTRMSPHQDYPRWSHVETGTLLFGLDEWSFEMLEEQLGPAERSDYPNGSQVAYMNSSISSVIVFANAGAAGRELIVCRPWRITWSPTEVNLRDCAFVSSRRLVLGDTPERVRAVLGPPGEATQENGCLVYHYHAAADFGAPCGACYDGEYWFENSHLVEMRFWDGS